MSGIELEVNQVWEVNILYQKEFLRKIIYLGRDDVVITLISNDNFNTCSTESYPLFNWTEKLHLITTADGTPYVAPVPKNDYRDGDVWEWHEDGYSSAILIIEHEGELKLTSNEGRPFPVAKSCLITHPQNYRLIYRDGKVVKDA